MWLELPTVWIAILNGLGVPVAHFGLSWAFTRMPARWFRPAAWPYRRWSGESVRIYEQFWRVKRWKSILPDAGSWFGGFPKKHLRSRDPVYLQHFVVETCRGEAAHWAQWCGISTFILWTPWPWALVLPAYAALSNLPCILLQRHNRRRIEAVLA
jgi:glycosyl-4,4'-diaponeurosporenoate acyltransferase